ncbi:hypothetical protein DOY81_003601 [Sarcophaga bullata]|nr:hypothetical protein DOY81_003601 [Sarcophaga bullata]
MYGAPTTKKSKMTSGVGMEQMNTSGTTSYDLGNRIYGTHFKQQKLNR